MALDNILPLTMSPLEDNISECDQSDIGKER